MAKAAACIDLSGCDNQPPFVRPRWCRKRVLFTNTEPSMTQQADFDSTDVNAIVARFERTGVLPEGRGIPQYGDVTGLQCDLTELIQRSRENLAEFERFQAAWKPPQEPEPAPPATPVAPPAE